MDMSKHYLAWYRRPLFWVVACAVALVCVAIAYVLTSISSWQELSKNATTSYSATKKAIIIVMNTENTSSQERVAALKQVTYVDSIQCEPSPLYAWQEDFVSSAQIERKRCTSTAEDAAVLLSNAQAVESYLESEAAIGDVLEAISVKDTLKEGDWQNEYKNVQKQEALLDGLHVAKNASITHQEAKERVAYLSQAWRSLLAADKDEDRDKFDKASKTLVQAYKGLEAVSIAAEKELAPLLKNLNTQLSK